MLFLCTISGKMSQKPKKKNKDLDKIKIPSKAEREKTFKVPLLEDQHGTSVAEGNI
jgi:hypothetical protein